MLCILSAHDITILYPVGTTTMETIEKKKRQAYLARNSPTKPLSGCSSRTLLDLQIVLWLWGVVNQVDAFFLNAYVGVTSTSSLESESNARAVAYPTRVWRKTTYSISITKLLRRKFLILVCWLAIEDTTPPIALLWILLPSVLPHALIQSQRY